MVDRSKVGGGWAVTPWGVLVGLGSTFLVGCISPGERAGIVQERDALSLRVNALQRDNAQRDGTIALLRKQIDNLQSFDDQRPAYLFAAVKVEIVSRSGGADYDGEPGDDGVTVYLQPRDAYGDVVKVPGLITIQLLDNSNMAAPRVLGVYRFGDPQELERLWYAWLATSHYTLRCPFRENIVVPESRLITVSASFLDYQTGATFTAVKEVKISHPTENNRSISK